MRKYIKELLGISSLERNFARAVENLLAEIKDLGEKIKKLEDRYAK